MIRAVNRRRTLAFWSLVAAIVANLATPVLAATLQGGGPGMERVVLCSPDGPRTVVLDLGAPTAQPASEDPAHCTACPICPPGQVPPEPGALSELVGGGFGTGLTQSWNARTGEIPLCRRFAHPFDTRAPPVAG